MTYLTDDQQQGVTIVIGNPPEKALLEAVTQLAIMGDVLLLAEDEPPFLAGQAGISVERIRPYTYHQTIKQLQEVQPTTAIVLLNMLAPLYRDKLPIREQFQLTRIAAKHVYHLGRAKPVLLTLKPNTAPHHIGLIKILRKIANQVYMFESPQEGGQTGLL